MYKVYNASSGWNIMLPGLQLYILIDFNINVLLELNRAEGKA